MCPASHSGSSLTQKQSSYTRWSSASSMQPSQESVSQIANIRQKTGWRKATKPLKAKTSSPKFNSTEKGKLTKGFLETGNEIFIMENEQPSSTLNGCYHDNTRKCLPGVNKNYRHGYRVQSLGKALWTLSLVHMPQVLPRSKCMRVWLCKLKSNMHLPAARCCRGAL